MSGLLQRERPSGSYIVETTAQFASVGFLYGYASGAFRESSATSPPGTSKAEMKVANRQVGRVGNDLGLYFFFSCT